ncbi:hypothetical protein F01_550016 [Burkholderia cenocepacia]|nr:hypothetical protein F01_550016 [Burkholderia cenocepacia]
MSRARFVPTGRGGRWSNPRRGSTTTRKRRESAALKDALARLDALRDNFGAWVETTKRADFPD